MNAEHKIRRAAERARVLFENEGWVWGSGAGFTPTVDQIAETYRELIDMARESGRAETGRLVVDETDLGTQLSVELGTIYPLDSYDDHNAMPRLRGL